MEGLLCLPAAALIVERIYLAKVGIYQCRLLKGLQISRPPGFVEPRLQWSIKPENNIETFTWHGLHPVLFIALWWFGRKVNCDTTVLGDDGGIAQAVDAT